MNRNIYAQSLYELVILKKKINPWDLYQTAEALYLSTKIVGINNTKITYKDTNGNKIVQMGVEIPEEMRAVAAFVKILIARWEGPSIGRLKKHYGLSWEIENYLPEGLHESKNRAAGMKYLTLQSFCEIYLR